MEKNDENVENLNKLDLKGPKNDGTTTSDSSSEEDEVNIKLHVARWDFNQCDPKTCSGDKLSRMKLIRTLNIKQRFHGLVLTPTAEKCVSPADRAIVNTKGIAVVDCSWDKIDETPIETLKLTHARVVPFLEPANPETYSEPNQLSCVEAIAATMYITGFKEEANFYLKKFPWGQSFIRVNAYLLELYSLSSDSEDLMQEQAKYFEQQRRLEEDRLAWRYRTSSAESVDSDEICEKYFS